nr:hypothetical protein [Vulcanisaeta sp. JCM 16159]
MGLLGITDVQSSIRQLVSAVGELTKTVQRLAEGQDRLWQEVRALREDQGRLWQENNKIWEEIKALREGQERLWQEVRALREDQNKLWQENNKIWQEIKALRESQDAMRTDINRLWEENKRINENIERLWQENRRINENIEKLWQENNKIWREIRSIRRTLEHVTLSIEEEANDVVQYFLRQRGIAVETKPTHFNSRFEFDVYGTNGQLTIVGEAKTRASPNTVRRVVEKIDDAVKAMPDKFPGRVIKVIYCLRAMPGAVEEANRLGVWFLESGRERNSPSI